MPTKMRPDDWDRLFAPRAPRRGGPLRALANVIIVFTMFFVVGLAAMYLLRYSNQRQASLIAAATARAATQQPLATATAQAAAAATAQRAATPTPAQPILGRGTVQQGGNLRREPRVAADTVVGLIWPGDQIEFLQQRSVDGQTWYQIRVVQPASNRAGQGVGAGTDGWASATLLSAPQP